MFICRYCGHVCHDEGINCCNNVNCKFYGKGSCPSKNHMMFNCPPKECKNEPIRQCAPRQECRPITQQCTPKQECRPEPIKQYMPKQECRPIAQQSPKQECRPIAQQCTPKQECRPIAQQCTPKQECRPIAQQCERGYEHNEGQRHIHNHMPQEYKAECGSSRYFTYEDYNQTHMTNNYDLMPNVNSCGQVGFATVPFENYTETYPINQALCVGTYFKDLNMPYDKKIIRRD